MRPFTAALLGLAVALPLGFANVSAHAGSDSDYHHQGQHSENGWNLNDNQGWHQQRGDAWNRDHEGWRRGSQRFGYNNGDEHHWDNNGWHHDNRHGDSNRGDRSDNRHGNND